MRSYTISTGTLPPQCTATSRVFFRKKQRLYVSTSYGSSVVAQKRNPRTITNSEFLYSSSLTRLCGLSASYTARGWKSNTFSSNAT